MVLFGLQKYWFYFTLILDLNMKMSGEFEFIRCFKITAPYYNDHCVLNCLCLRWATDEKTDHSRSRSFLAAALIEAGE